MWRRVVWWVVTNVSKELAAHIFRVEKMEAGPPPVTAMRIPKLFERLKCTHSFSFLKLNSREPGQLSRYSEGLRAGRPGFNSRQGQETFLYTGSGAYPAFLSSGYRGRALSSEVKHPRREADYSPSSAEVKNGDLYLHFPICRHGMVLN
jgi:hypothetical protein